MTRPIGDRLEAAALILHFLAHVGEARIERICRYMESTPLRFAPGTTRNTVVRLKRQGKIVRVGYARYRVAPGVLVAPPTRNPKRRVVRRAHERYKG